MFEGMFRGKKKSPGIGRMEVGEENMLSIRPSLGEDGVESGERTREPMKGEVLKGKNESVPQANPSPERVQKPEEGIQDDEQAPANPPMVPEDVAVPTSESSPQQESSPAPLARSELIAESTDDSVLQELLDATARKKSTLADFKGILNKVNANEGQDISYDQLEKIGLTAAKRLEGRDYNAFKKYIAGIYDLNNPDIIQETPDLDFLRDPAVRPVREQAPPTADMESTAPHIMKQKQASEGEGAIAAEKSKEIEDLRNETKEMAQNKKEAPENLPGSSKDEYTAFEENLRKSVADWREKRGKTEERKTVSPLSEEQRQSINNLMDLNERDRQGDSGSMKEGTRKEWLDKLKRSVASVYTYKAKERPKTNEHVERPESHLGEQPKTPKNSAAKAKGESYEMKRQHEMAKRGEQLELYLKESAEHPDDPATKIKEELRAAQERIRMSERGAGLKEYLTEAGILMQEGAEKYGKPFAQFFGRQIERYNKLNWKTRTAITFGLMAGAMLTGPGGWLTAALWTTRGVGALGFAMNRRAAIDKKLEAGKNVWFVGDSERSKNARATVEAALYMASTSALMYGGIELGKMAIQSEWFHSLGTAAKEGIDTVKEFDTTKWLAGMLDKLPSLPDGGLKVPAGSEGAPPIPPTGGLETDAAGAPDMRGPEGLPFTKDELEALAPTPDMPSGEAAPMMPEGHPEDYNITDPRFDDQIAEARAEVDKGIAGAKEHLGKIDELLRQQQTILDQMPPAETPQASVPETGIAAEGAAGSSQIPLDTSPAPETVAPPEPAPTESLAPAEVPAQASEGKLGPNKMFDVQERMEQGLPPSEPGPFKGLEDTGGQTPEQFLKEHMRDPRETGAQGYQPPPPEEKGFFERLFGSPDTAEAAGQFSVDSVSATEPHIYADAGENLMAFGGTPAEQAGVIYEYLKDNPGKIIFGTDEGGTLRIPFYLVDGQPQMADAVPSSGFLGLFPSLMDAPKPEEFVKIIK